MRLGADPEVFLVNNKTGEFVSAINKIGGSKYDPLQVKGLPKGFTLQEDNVALEFGIPPAKSAATFVKYIQTVMNAGLSKIEQDNLEFSSMSAVFFPKEQLNCEAAQVFGCEPDFNAWTGEMNPKPKSEDPTLRSAGGHVHIETKLNPNLVGQACDLYLGVPSLILDDKGSLRRQLGYGRGGAIRYKPYGIEYRTLSNFWIFSPKHIRWVWNQVARALLHVEEGRELPSAVEVVINEDDKKMAKYLTKEYKLVY